MSFLEDRILKMLELRDLGRSDEEIAGSLEISVESVRECEKRLKELNYEKKIPETADEEMGISPRVLGVFKEYEMVWLRRGIRKNREEYIERIKNAIEKGAGGMSDIMSKVGLTHHYLTRLAEEEGIELPHYEPGEMMKRKKLERIERMREVFARGLKTAREIASETGISYKGVFCLAKEAGIKLVRSKRGKEIRARKRRFSDEDANKMIREGRSLGEMATDLEISRQGVSYYIKSTEQDELWREKRKERKNREKEEKNAPQRLVDLLLWAAYKKAGESDYAHQEAYEYYLGNLTRRKNMSEERVEMIARLITVYKETEERGEKVKLAELGKKAGVYGDSDALISSRVSHILSNIGLGSFFKEYQRRLSEEEKKMIQRAYNIDMNVADLSYFLGIHRATLGIYFHVMAQEGVCKRRAGKERGVFQLGISSSDKLTYRKASKIYEAEDACFSSEEVCEYAECSEKVRQYAVKNRRKIGRKIARDLRKIMSDKSIKKPYLQRRER